jgi:hypothetical protein
MDCPFLQEYREADTYTGKKSSANVKWLCYKRANSQVLNIAEFIYSSNNAYRTIVTEQDGCKGGTVSNFGRDTDYPDWIFVAFLNASRQIPV